MTQGQDALRFVKILSASEAKYKYMELPKSEESFPKKRVPLR